MEAMKGLSPIQKLNQGYSYVSDEEGRTFTDVGKVSIGERLHIYVKNGRVETEVKGIYPRRKG